MNCKIKQIITILLLLINQNVFCQQFKNHNILSFEKSDSVVVSKMYYRDKEFSASLSINLIPAKKDSITGELTLPYYKEEKDTLYELSRKRLTSEQVATLNRFLKNKKNYNNKDVTLLNHYDVEINYYQKGIVFQYVRISSITNKISIFRDGCKSILEMKKEEVNLCLFYSSIGSGFKKFILKLTSK